jgi:hypothetical protein
MTQTEDNARTGKQGVDQRRIRDVQRQLVDHQPAKTRCDMPMKKLEVGRSRQFQLVRRAIRKVRKQTKLELSCRKHRHFLEHVHIEVPHQKSVEQRRTRAREPD